ncbi:ATP synthase F1 subunit epsilon [Candidatus Uhrbacteria bacterium]|nr:ATP synthase F1 subunit epsilon [Candidatus Uhrbacteria bacterium]
MKLRIITPERLVFEEDIDQVTLPTQEGEITVLPHHIPLVSIIQPGEIFIKKGKQDIPLAVSGGMLQVRPDEIIVLADSAERVEEIIEERAEQARVRALAMLEEKRHDSTQYAQLAAKIEKETARLRVARKHRKQHIYPTQSQSEK